MAIVKPLVMSSTGQIERLQPGDTLAELEQIQLIADDDMIAGNVVYSSAAGHIDLAKADSATTAKPVGLTTAAIANGATGGVQSDGILTLTTTEWDAVFGTTGGLTYNTIYFLSAGTAGLGTATSPSTTSQYVIPIGQALSTTDFKINIGQSVLL